MQNELKNGLRIMVFIPARNEEQTIGEVIQGVTGEISRVINVKPDVVVGDDGSTDRTAEISKKMGATVLGHEISVGLGTNFHFGVEYALAKNYDVLLTVDGDSQFSPKDAPKLLAPIIAGEKDFVTGSRFLSSSEVIAMPKIKRWGNDCMSQLISSIIGKRFKDVSCGYRAYSRKALCNLNLFGKYTYTQEVFLNLGYKDMRIAEVPIWVTYPKERRSRIAASLLRYGIQTLTIILGSWIMYRPMRFFGRIASLLGAIGTVTLLILGARFFFTATFTPYKFLAIGAGGLLFIALLSLSAGLFLHATSRLQFTADKLLAELRERK